MQTTNRAATAFVSISKRFSNSQSTNNFWKDQVNQRKFLDDLAKKFNIKKEEEWYNFPLSEIEKNGGRGLLLQYQGSAVKAITGVYNNFNWKIHKFAQVPKGYWDDPIHQRELFDEIWQILNIKQFSEWYKVKTKDFLETGANFLITKKYGSLARALISIYPQYNWEFWKFHRVSKELWEDKKNQMKFLENFCKQFKISNNENWYNISSSDIIEYGGNGLLNLYKGSLISMLGDIFPNENWKPWKFEEFSKENWNDLKIQRKFLDEVSEKLNIKTFENWYSIKEIQIIDLGGKDLLDLYFGSLYEALVAIYPENLWRLPTNEKVRQGFWKVQRHQRLFFDHLAKTLNLGQWQEWFYVTSREIQRYGGNSILEHFGDSPIKALKAAYPEYPWEGEVPSGKFWKSMNASKTQLRVFSTLNEIFPQIKDIHINYKHPEMKYKESQETMEFDIFIPSLHLAFEYQGVQHFQQSSYLEGNLQKYQLRDIEKRKACESNGITLIEIPHTWGGSYESLIEILHKHKLQVSKEIFTVGKLTLKAIENV